MSTIFKDGFEVGNFGFFKDNDLTLKLTEDNLFDQIDANGWIDIWFGGTDVWIPDFGTYNVFLTCEKTFFWDITDSNGVRTKDGFSEVFIVNNPSMEPFYGDLIPDDPSEVFEFYSGDYSASVEQQLICSNLWFYANYFKDEYFRYNLLILDKQYSWPDEVNVSIRPMNDKLKILENEYIVGYRPKPEYMNQLSVVRNMSSGVEHSIHFKLKVDLSFLSENPDTRRRINVFVGSGDKIEYLLYPRNLNDILWDNHSNKFFSIFQRFLLKFGISQYTPRPSDLEYAEKYYKEMIETSNKILLMDISNLDLAAKMIDQKLVDENHLLTGYAAVVFDDFREWVTSNIQIQLPQSIKEIIIFTINNELPFSGFEKLDEYLGGLIGDFSKDVFPDIHDGNEEIIFGNEEIVFGGLIPIYYNPSVNIVNIISEYGIRQFENGYAPGNADGYLNPPDGYVYEGATGSGMYKISTKDGEIVDIFCDMDNGGWMSLIVSSFTDLDFLSQFSDTSDIRDSFYSDPEFGIGWGTDSNKVLLIDNFVFSEIEISISGSYSNPENGIGFMDIRLNSEQFIHFYDSSKLNEDGQNLYVKGECVLDGQSENVVNMSVQTERADTDSLSIKMGGEINEAYSRRYINKIKIR